MTHPSFHRIDIQFLIIGFCCFCLGFFPLALKSRCLSSFIIQNEMKEMKVSDPSQCYTLRPSEARDPVLLLPSWVRNSLGVSAVTPFQSQIIHFSRICGYLCNQESSNKTQERLILSNQNIFWGHIDFVKSFRTSPTAGILPTAQLHPLGDRNSCRSFRLPVHIWYLKNHSGKIIPFFAHKTDTSDSSPFPLEIFYTLTMKAIQK